MRKVLGHQNAVMAQQTQQSDTTNSTDVTSPYVKSHGVTKMVIEVELTPKERAEIDTSIHAVMDMEAQVDFHLDMFKKQLGTRLKRLLGRRLALHVAWKTGKSRRIIEVEVFEDDRTHEVTRVRTDTGDVVTKRVLDQREQLALFSGTSQYLPECDDTTAKQFAAEQQNDIDELVKLLMEPDWSEIQRSLAEQLGMTVDELAASAGDRSAKKPKKKKIANAGSSSPTNDAAEEAGGESEEQS